MGVESGNALQLVPNQRNGARPGVGVLRTTRQALDRSDARYRALIQASAAAAWRAAPDGAVVQVCDWERYPGIQQDALGEGWLDLLHPDDRDRARAYWSRTVAAAKGDSIEYRIDVPGQGYRWMLSRAVPLLDLDGNVEEWVGMVTDIHERKTAQEEIRWREERYRLAARATKDAIWDWDLVTNEIAWGEAANEFFGCTPGDLGSMSSWWENNIHPDDRDRVLTGIAAVLRGGEAHWSEEYRFRRADSSYAEVFDRGFVIRDDTGAAIRMVGAMQDISESRRAQAALRASEERLRLALQAGRMYAWERDLATDYVTRSDHAKELIGLESGPAWEFIARVHPEDSERAPQVLRAVWGGEADRNELRYVRPDGEMLWLAARSVEIDEPGKPKRLIGVTFDLTERKRAEAELWRLANQDPLTELPNRMQFLARFERALAEARQVGTTVSLLLFDLDNFKDVNDTLGHDAGDALLREVGRRLQAMVRDCDTVARVGGDEFAMLVVAPLTLDHAVRFGDHVIETVRQPFAHAGRLLEVKASAGVAAFPDHDATVPELMKDADIALYRAKAQGRNGVVRYTPEMRDAMEERVRVSAEVRAALTAGEIVPFYQPKVCLSSGRVVGFEALARWHHPEKGVLTPGYFGAAFKDADIAEMIGEAMVRQVAADLREWTSTGFACGTVAVNLSSAEFRHPDVADSILDVLRAVGVAPASFEVEVTETVLLGANADLVAKALNRFHDAGVKIALDDFGTGYASLTHLKQFPVDHIKIDQTFVRGLVTNRHDEAIVSAVVGLSKGLGLHVTAEGIETEAQARRLRELGCHFGQGYLIGRPMAGSRVGPWIEAQDEARPALLRAVGS